jgi:hypothetical protein
MTINKALRNPIIGSILTVLAMISCAHADVTVANASFESPTHTRNDGTNPDNWTVVESTAGTAPDRQVRTRQITSHAGVMSVQLAAYNQPHDGELYQTVITEIGEEYTVSIWGNVLNENLNTLENFRLDVLAGTGLGGGSLASLDSAGALTTSWQRFSINFTATSTDTTIWIRDTSTALASDGNDISLDDVSIIVASPPAAPSIPDGLVVTPNNNRNDLDWNDNAQLGFLEFRVKRSITPGGPYAQIGTPTTSAFADNTALNGTLYYYVVTAVNIEGAESASCLEETGVPSLVTVEVYLLGGQSNMQTAIRDAFVARMKSLNPSQSIFAAFHRNSGEGLHSGWDVETWRGDNAAPGRGTYYPGLNASDPNVGVSYTALLADWQSQLDAIGSPYTIKGIVWVQGEKDSKEMASGTQYGENLTLLINRFHQDLALDAPIPFAYSSMESTVTAYLYGDEIRANQINVDHASGHANSVSNAYRVDASGLSYSDGIHYVAASQTILGQRIADTMQTALGRESFAQWQQRWFGEDAGNPTIAGESADADSDGINNLLEFAYNLDPLLPPEIGVLYEGPPIISNADGIISYTYRVNLNASGLTVIAEQTTNLVTEVNWHPLSGTRETLSDDGHTRVIFISPPVSYPKLFMRLRVTID